MGACLAKDGSDGPVAQAQARDVAAVAESRQPKLGRDSDYGESSKIVQGEGQVGTGAKLETHGMSESGAMRRNPLFPHHRRIRW